MVSVSIVLLHHVHLLLLFLVFLLILNFINVTFLNLCLVVLVQMRRRDIGLLLFDGSVLFLGILLLSPSLLVLLLDLPLFPDFRCLPEYHLLQLLLLANHLQPFLLNHLLLLLLLFLHLLKHFKVLLLEILSETRLLFFIEFFAISPACQFAHKDHWII